MNNKAILRTQKLNHRASIRRSLKHAFREQDTPNADDERTPDNTHFGASCSTDVMQAFEGRMPEKVRKNAVLAIEYFIGGSPEAMNAKSQEEQDKYFNDALDWLKDKHGEENVIYSGIHRDESTPHMYAYVVPIDPRGKLCCRHFLGGSKALTQMQTDFAETVGIPNGLERGVEGSKARHQKIKDYYAQINQPDPVVSIPKRDVRLLTSEREDDYRDRVEATVKQQLKPIFEKAKKADMAEKRAEEHARTAEYAQKQVRVWKEEVKKAKEFVERLTSIAMDKIKLSRLVSTIKMLGGRTKQEVEEDKKARFNRLTDNINELKKEKSFQHLSNQQQQHAIERQVKSSPDFSTEEKQLMIQSMKENYDSNQKSKSKDNDIER